MTRPEDIDLSKPMPEQTAAESARMWRERQRERAREILGRIGAEYAPVLIVSEPQVEAARPPLPQIPADVVRAYRALWHDGRDKRPTQSQVADQLRVSERALRERMHREAHVDDWRWVHKLIDPGAPPKR